jgi:methionyl-tRNA formyltransferase
MPAARQAQVAKPGILVFAYHDVGYECLDALVRRDKRVLAVFTHEDHPNETIWFKSVAQLARAHGIPVYTPDDVNTTEWIARIRGLRPDIIFSFYYRNMICQAILDIPRLGAFNLHGSLLPRYRGRVPINWAIINGEIETGATLHYMVQKPDAGDIVDQEAVAIGPQETARDVFVKVTQAARRVLERQIDAIEHGTPARRPQDVSRATYFGGRRPEDGRIDWRRSAPEIFNLIRAVTHPYPGAYTEVDGRRLYIWWALPQPPGQGRPGEIVSTAPLRVAAGSGGLEIIRLQWQDGNEQLAVAGNHGLAAGQQLGAAQPASTCINATN